MSQNPQIDKNKIKSLVEKYKKVLRQGNEDDFSEEDVKVKFLNPLFESLGWDVRGLDVAKFEQTTITGRTDFALRTSKNEKPVLFVETKSLKEKLDGHRTRRGEKISYPQQTIDDAWSMKVDWAILTNFHRLRFYYTHVRNPSDGLQFELKFDEFLSDEGLEKLKALSKDGVKSGYLRRYEKERTREDVNSKFVDDLYNMRKKLVGDVRERNKIEENKLRESVQRILDRLVVIRVAEDRKILNQDGLYKIIKSWEETSINPDVRTLMKELKFHFREIDSEYNSKIFEEHPCENLDISNNVLREIVNSLYNYNFNLIDADILGAIYEDYIGHMLEEKEEGVDIKPDEKKKTEEGIYYTPTFVVDYIVNQTLGKSLKEASLAEGDFLIYSGYLSNPLVQTDLLVLFSL